MAFSDFDTYSNTNWNSYSSTPNTGSSEIYNGTLTSPTGSAGLVARKYAISIPNRGTVLTDAYVENTLNSSAASGLFFPTPSTRAISVNAWMRATPGGFSSFLNNSNFFTSGLMCKGYRTSTLETAGYRLAFSNRSGFGLYLYERSPRNNDISSFICDGTYNPNQWYRIRMDVLPRSEKDQIFAYVHNGTSWDEVGFLERRRLDVGYAVWDNTSYRTGFYTHVATYSQAGSLTMYLDKFEAHSILV